MGYTATDPVISSIADLVWQERPEWDRPLVGIILRDLARYVDGSDLAIAALRAAQNRAVPEPRAIAWRGPHWRDLNSLPPEAKAQARCSVCGKVESRCLTERPGPDDHRFEPTDPTALRVRRR